MRHLGYILLVVFSVLCLSTNAQTPYDSFAPETSRPMLGIEKTKSQTDSILCAVVAGMQNQILLLVDVSNGEVIASAPLTDDVHKWLSVDPLADKYPNISPYSYCGWNPVKFVDPDGRDIYCYDAETGDIMLYKKTDDNFDQFGKFKYNRKTGEYEPRLNKDGSIKTYTDHRGNNDKIAKGILHDGLNIKQNGSSFISNDNAGPSINDYFNFALILDEVAGVEISGFVFEAPWETNKKIVLFEPYKDNSYNNSNSTLHYLPESWKAIYHFHTHGHANTYQKATTPSGDRDLLAKPIISKFYPGIQLLILHNYGSPIRY